MRVRRNSRRIIELSKNDLVFVRGVKRFVGKNDGVVDDGLGGYNDVGAENGDGRIQLALVVEQSLAVDLGKGFVRIGIHRRA